MALLNDLEGPVLLSHLARPSSDRTAWRWRLPQQQNRVPSVPLTFFVRAAGCLTHHATAANEIRLTRAVVFIFVRRSRYCLTLRYIARGRPTNEDRNSSVLRRTSISECGYRQWAHVPRRPFNSRQKELSAHFCDVVFVMTIWKIENECKKSSNLLLFLLSFF